MTRSDPPDRARAGLVAATVVALVVVVVTALLLAGSDPVPTATPGFAVVPGVPAGPVTQRWAHPVDRPLHDIVVVGDLVVVVEFAPLRQGLAPGVLMTALDVVDGRVAWQRRVPGRSIVVLSDGTANRALVDVASAFDRPSTIRGVAINDGAETWTRPADGASGVAWGPGGTIVLAGEDCRLLDGDDGEVLAPDRSAATACARAGRPTRRATVVDAGGTWDVDADPQDEGGPSGDGGSDDPPDRLVVRDGRRVVTSLTGSQPVVLDAFDDQHLGGQLTTLGVLVPTTEEDGTTLSLLGLPDLAPRWSADLDGPVVRLAPSRDVVVVATATRDDRVLVRALR